MIHETTAKILHPSVSLFITLFVIAFAIYIYIIRALATFRQRVSRILHDIRDTIKREIYSITREGLTRDSQDFRLLSKRHSGRTCCKDLVKRETIPCSRVFDNYSRTRKGGACPSSGNCFQDNVDIDRV